MVSLHGQKWRSWVFPHNTSESEVYRLKYKKDILCPNRQRWKASLHHSEILLKSLKCTKDVGFLLDLITSKLRIILNDDIGQAIKNTFATSWNKELVFRVYKNL